MLGRSGILSQVAGNPTALVPSSDSRLALRWDPDLTINSTNYPGRYAVQCSASPGAAGSAFSDLATPLMHADGTTLWAGYEASSAHGGKTALTLRLKEGQGGHWGTYHVTTNPYPTLRAEVLGPSDNYSGPIGAAFDERGLTYWLAFDFAIDDDIVTNTGLQSSGARNVIALHGLHSQNWADDLPTWAHSSGQDSMRLWLKGSTLVWGHAAPGTGNWFRCDVRTTPLNTTFTEEEAAGSDYGLPREWQVADLNAGESIQGIAKVTLGNTGSYNPRTELWIKQGTGLMTKRIDYTGNNTFSTGIRYAKMGAYSWEPNSTWWGNKNTRTIRFRSMATFRADSGTPGITVTNLSRWLNR